MNNLLDITGHFLYLAVSIILLPVFIALDIFIGAWLMARFIKRRGRILYIRAKKKQPVYHPAFKKSFLFLKAKSIGMPANGH
jgi:hypothetical protein